MGGITRQERYKRMSIISKKIEKIDTLYDNIVLYKKVINSTLKEISSNPVIRNQIKNALGIPLTL